MAERLSREQINEAMDKQHQASLMQHAEDRRRVLAHASHIVRILRGDVKGVDPLDFHVGGPFTDSLPGMPEVAYNRTVVPASDDREALNADIIGSLGAYCADEFTNERPADILQAGFYAGVIATREGLVDPSLFLTEDEQRQATHQAATPEAES